MKKVCIVNIKNNQTFQNISENPTEWINDCIINNYWGKPERWVRAKELMENGNPEEPEHWMWHSEYYEESDILETELVIDEDTGDTHTLVLLKADYTIEVIDLETDYDYQLQQCYENRKREYGDIEKQLGEIFDNFDKWKDRITKVKQKIPKPIKEKV